MTPDLISAVLDVHLRGAFNVTQPVYAHMREKGYGRIINTSSNSGILGNFGQANYGAAKMGLVGLTRVLAIEGRRYNIKANAIAPVAFTRMTEEILGAELGQKLDPKLVTPLVCWLASDDVDVSGEVYSAAGGVVARFFIGLTPGYYNPRSHGRGCPRPLEPDPGRRRVHRSRRLVGRAPEAGRHPRGRVARPPTYSSETRPSSVRPTSFGSTSDRSTSSRVSSASSCSAMLLISSAS